MTAASHGFISAVKKSPISYLLLSTTMKSMNTNGCAQSARLQRVGLWFFNVYGFYNFILSFVN